MKVLVLDSNIGISLATLRRYFGYFFLLRNILTTFVQFKWKRGHNLLTGITVPAECLVRYFCSNLLTLAHDLWLHILDSSLKVFLSYACFSEVMHELWQVFLFITHLSLTFPTCFYFEVLVLRISDDLIVQHLPQIGVWQALQTKDWSILVFGFTKTLVL